MATIDKLTYTHENTEYELNTFNPWNAWTTWQVLTKTANGYEYANAPVTSVNTQTWAVVLDADDISDSTTTNKFVTATDKTTWSGKQDALTLPATPTQWNLVTWWANNKSLVDWWAIPTGVPAVWTNGQVLTVVS